MKKLVLSSLPSESESFVGSYSARLPPAETDDSCFIPMRRYEAHLQPQALRRRRLPRRGTPPPGLPGARQFQNPATRPKHRRPRNAPAPWSRASPRRSSTRSSFNRADAVSLKQQFPISKVRAPRDRGRARSFSRLKYRDVTFYQFSGVKRVLGFNRCVWLSSTVMQATERTGGVVSARHRDSTETPGDPTRIATLASILEKEPGEHRLEAIKAARIPWR